jgi:large subunit ribosomal protein L21
MYAVVRIAGQQVRAEAGRRIRVPHLAVEEGTQQDFCDVLLVATDQGQTRVGTPAVDGATVKATVVGHGRGPKIVVFKMKRRKGYRRRNGHRQDYTEIRVDEIVLPN